MCLCKRSYIAKANLAALFAQRYGCGHNDVQPQRIQPGRFFAIIVFSFIWDMFRHYIDAIYIFLIFSFCILISFHGDARHGELSRGYFVQQTNKEQHCNLTGGNVHKSGFPSKWLLPTKRSQHTVEHTCYRAFRANLWELDYKSRYAWWILESNLFCMFI